MKPCEDLMDRYPERGLQMEAHFFPQDEDEPVLVTEPDRPPMTDAEAFYCLKRISAVQSELASIDANAKTMKAQAVSDLRDFLGNFDRLTRLTVWRALTAGKNRKSVTTLAGSCGEKTVPARCVVEDVGLALPWLKANIPGAVVEKIKPEKLPKPFEIVDEYGVSVWVAPGDGLRAEDEREEITVNGRMLSALLKGATDGDE